MPVTWTKPELVCEIKYSEITKDGIFRHPVFVGIREDKEPEEVKISSAELKTTAKSKLMKTSSDSKNSDSDKEITLNRHKVKLTNQNKIYFPKDDITKGDVIEYYHRQISIDLIEDIIETDEEDNAEDKISVAEGISLCQKLDKLILIYSDAEGV